MRMRVSFALLAVAAVLVSATGVTAQACCSAAPQAGPGSASGGGVGSLFPGQGWVQASMLTFNTGRQFGVGGVEQPYLNDGRLDLQSFLLTGAVGLVTGLEVWAQGAVHSLKFEDAGTSLTRTGLGDARVWLRAGPGLLGIRDGELPVWVGVRAGVKLPGSEFPIERTVLPLTEGQTDAEVALEVGKVFGQGRFAAQTWVGYRWRGRNVAAVRKPGNEWFGYGSVAAAAGRIEARVSAQLLSGAPYQSLGVVTRTSRRKLFGVYPTLATRIGPGSIEVGAQVPVTGQNLPTGPAFTLGYTLGFGSPPLPSLDVLFPS
jgi:hypothetical protein